MILVFEGSPHARVWTQSDEGINYDLSAQQADVRPLAVRLWEFLDTALPKQGTVQCLYDAEVTDGIEVGTWRIRWSKPDGQPQALWLQVMWFSDEFETPAAPLTFDYPCDNDEHVTVDWQAAEFRRAIQAWLQTSAAG